MMNEHEAIGFYLSAHPLDGCAAALGRLGATPLDQLAETIERGVVRLRVAGVVLGKQERGAAGQRFAFIRVSDPSGSQEVAVFREVYATARELIEPGRSVLVTATARSDGGTIKLTAQSIEDLQPRLASQMNGLTIRLREAAPLRQLDAVLRQAKAGKARLSLLIEAGDEEIAIELPRSVVLSPGLRAEIASIPGVLAVFDA
jgi:DNA polymerase-3 subunit alpha